MPDFKLTEADGKLLEGTAKSIENDIRELKVIGDIFKGSILPNIKPYWQGPAQEVFEKQFIAYADTYESFVKAHDDLNEKLKAAGETYEKADESVRQSIDSLPR
ncbi:MAG TPA: WXG100 family type VII secretion target [Anaerovoracaceae bacterium]|nr:WXG100 family type VII secretion target [Anaerovoracaceae bacterium]